jgi:hypothetical protein
MIVMISPPVTVIFYFYSKERKDGRDETTICGDRLTISYFLDYDIAMFSGKD